MSEENLPSGRTLVWTVGALQRAVSDSLTARFGGVSVRGELSGVARAASGHAYFQLKDGSGEPALIRCAMFRRAASLLDFAPADGLQVEVRGRLAIYEARGELQLIVESMRRLGAGSLYEEFLRLRARLEGLGLFDPTRKRTPARQPRALGVVTSLGAAALRDVVTALRRRSPHVPVVVYPCLVQGADAPVTIVDALAMAQARAEVDTLLLVRGGGSLEDLWAFNDERVVRAVAACTLPVICGVGHETDVTLSDLAADLRAATPTAAAELAAPVRDEALESLRRSQDALTRGVLRRLDQQGQRLDLLAQRAGAPGRLLARQGDKLQGLAYRLQSVTAARLERGPQWLAERARRMRRAQELTLGRAGLRLDAWAARLEALNPQRVLERGYAWLEDASGQPVVSSRGVQVAQALRAVLSDGSLAVEVLRVEPSGGDPAQRGAAPDAYNPAQSSP